MESIYIKETTSGEIHEPNNSQFVTEILTNEFEFKDNLQKDIDYQVVVSGLDEDFNFKVEIPLNKKLTLFTLPKDLDLAENKEFSFKIKLFPSAFIVKGKNVPKNNISIKNQEEDYLVSYFFTDKEVINITLEYSEVEKYIYEKDGDSITDVVLKPQNFIDVGISNSTDDRVKFKDQLVENIDYEITTLALDDNYTLSRVDDDTLNVEFKTYLGQTSKYNFEIVVFQSAFELDNAAEFTPNLSKNTNNYDFIYHDKADTLVNLNILSTDQEKIDSAKTNYGLKIKNNSPIVTFDYSWELSDEKLPTVLFKDLLSLNDFDVSTTNGTFLEKSDVQITADQFDKKNAKIKFLDFTAPNGTTNSQITIDFKSSACTAEHKQDVILNLENSSITKQATFFSTDKGNSCWIKLEITNQFANALENIELELEDRDANLHQLVTDITGKVSKEVACGLVNVKATHPENLEQGVFEDFSIFFPTYTKPEDHDFKKIFFYHDGASSLPRGVHPFSASISNYKDKNGNYKAYGWGKNENQQTGVVLLDEDKDTNNNTDANNIYEPFLIANPNPNTFIKKISHNKFAVHALFANIVDKKTQSIGFLGTTDNCCYHGINKGLVQHYETFNEFTSLEGITEDDYEINLGDYIVNSLSKSPLQANINSAGNSANLEIHYASLGRDASGGDGAFLKNTKNTNRGDLTDSNDLIVQIKGDNFTLALSQNNNL